MPHPLLVATVGGSPQPLVASLLNLAPERVIFLCSGDSRSSVDRAEQDNPGVLQRLRKAGRELPAGQYDVVEVADPQDLEGLARTVHLRVTPLVEQWAARGPDFEVVVDFTAGTKCMTGALLLAARQWPCRLVYVGGSMRTKGDVGVVVDGAEVVLRQSRPWDSLGYQTVEEVLVLFRGGNVAAAAELVRRARKLASEGPLRAALTALAHCMETFEAWDQFEHETALRKLRDALTQQHALIEILTPERLARLTSALAAAQPLLEILANTRDANGGRIAQREHCLDLLGNAARRTSERRYDDAVARLYRVAELAAQLELRDRHGIPSTARVPVGALPETLRERWQARVNDGVLMLGLQDDYELLGALGSDLARRFQELGLASRTGSPFVARNNSILAHGFAPVSEKVACELQGVVERLIGAAPDEIPRFPVI